MTIELFVLSQGFPDFKPPQFVIDALVESTKDIKCHQYTRGPVRSICINGSVIIDVFTCPIS